MIKKGVFIIKSLAIIIIFIVLSDPSMSSEISPLVIEVLKAARLKAIPTIDLSWVKPYDNDYQKNQEAIKNNDKYLKNRFITFYTDENYSIRYTNPGLAYTNFYYIYSGHLYAVQFESDLKLENNEQTFLIRYKYNYPSGLIESITVIYNEVEYEFDRSNNLICTWKKNYQFDPKGKMVKVRS